MKSEILNYDGMNLKEIRDFINPEWHEHEAISRNSNLVVNGEKITVHAGEIIVKTDDEFIVCLPVGRVKR